MTSWTHLSREQQIAQLEKDWAENPRWKGIKRGYSAADVVKLRGSPKVNRRVRADWRGNDSALVTGTLGRTSLSESRRDPAGPRSVPAGRPRPPRWRRRAPR